MTAELDAQALILSLHGDVRDHLDRLEGKLDQSLLAHAEVDKRLVQIETKVRVAERIGWGALAAAMTALAGHIKALL